MYLPYVEIYHKGVMETLFYIYALLDTIHRNQVNSSFKWKCDIRYVIILLRSDRGPEYWQEQV